MRNKIAEIIKRYEQHQDGVWGEACIQPDKYYEVLADKILALFKETTDKSSQLINYWQERALKAEVIIEELPSLDGIVVEEECPQCWGSNDCIEEDCKVCHGIGYITRPAEWGDIKIVATNDGDRMPVLACKEVGRLRVK